MDCVPFCTPLSVPEQAVRLGRFGVLTFLDSERGTFPWVSKEG
jgi:hypothetical protein